MYEMDQTFLGYEVAYRAERMRGERPDQHHDGHRTRPARRRWNGRIVSRRAA